jgi:hypothetical protein
MLDAAQLDPMGSLITEARSDAEVAALVDTRVRGFEPAPGDAKGSGEYQAFIVISALNVTPIRRVPVTFAEYGIRAYGSTPQNAWAVWGALVKVFEGTTPRVKSNGLGIYQTFVVSGGEQGSDPDTKQPVVLGSIRVVATTQAVGE